MKLHRNVTSTQEASAERNLFGIVAALRTAQECRAFFRDLCTPAEIQAMADRWAVVDWLQRGVPYREIHRLTGVSVTTISRVARFLANGNGGYSLATRRSQLRRRPQPLKRAGSSASGDSARSSDGARGGNGARGPAGTLSEGLRHG